MFDLTFSLLLKKRTIHADGGYAKALIRTGIESPLRGSFSLGDRLMLGVDESDTVQRSCALILTGMIFGLIRDREIIALYDSARKSNIVWPIDTYRIGLSAINYSDRNEYIALRILYARYPREMLKQMPSFFRGLERGVLALKDDQSRADMRWHVNGSDEAYIRWSIHPATEYAAI